MQATWDWQLAYKCLRDLMSESEKHVTLNEISKRLADGAAMGIAGYPENPPLTREMVRLVLRSRPEWSKLWDQNMARRGPGYRSRYAAR